MKVLLLGDFSSFFLNLKEALIELGHSVILASNGDGSRNIDRDIDIGHSQSKYLSKIKQKISPLLYRSEFSNHDIVQYINPFYFYARGLPNRSIIKFLIKNNGGFFISAAGDDSYFWSQGRDALKYGPFDDFLKYDIKKNIYYMERKHCIEFNKWIVENTDGVIPVMYEYERSYFDSPKLKQTIPLPINLQKIKFQSLTGTGKLVVFHGLSRYGFKGTRHIEEAFNILRHKYKDDLELIIAGNMPIDKYLQTMSRASIVIDQTNSYSLGMNGIYALAMGKVVLGGAEPESLNSLGISYSPVFNITPAASSIIKTIEHLLERRSEIPEIGYQGRVLTETTHCHIKVAEKYLKIWSNT